MNPLETSMNGVLRPISGAGSKIGSIDEGFRYGNPQSLVLDDIYLL
ncbi:hypothetical protein MUB24_22210 [Lederbergia sp. NSJ-179]|nr:hypothetical protein [Lederbergia sp. NSJ-179]MCJ7843537.1 hypothetical protein [Lederbergia sp. NSJ-179]